MSLVALSGPTTIALASTFIFLLVMKFWYVFAHSVEQQRDYQIASCSKPRSDSAMNWSDWGANNHSSDRRAGVFGHLCDHLPAAPQGMFEDLPQWQLILVLVLFGAAALYTPID